MEKSSELSLEIQWFIETLRTKFKVETTAEEIGYESVELGVREMGEFFVPLEVAGKLPDTFLYELMVCDDDDGNVWVCGVAYYPDSPDWCLQLIMKNDNLVLRNALPKPAETHDKTKGGGPETDDSSC